MIIAGVKAGEGSMNLAHSAKLRRGKRKEEQSHESLIQAS
jgi:hypothetical protein